MSLFTEMQQLESRIKLPRGLKRPIKKYLVDGVIVVVMGVLLFWGYSTSGAFTRMHTDVGRYECYAVAFLYGRPRAIYVFPYKQCVFLVKDAPPPLPQRLKLQGWPAHLLKAMEARQPGLKPLHTLPLEYPVLSVIPLTLGMAAHSRWYRVAFPIEMALVAAIIYIVLLRFRSRKAAIAFAFYLVVGSWATAEGRFDLLPAGLTLLALICAQRAKWKWAFALLALATMFKYYPLVLIVPFLIAQQKQYHGRKWYAWRRWEALSVFTAMCAGITALSLILSIEGTLAPFGYLGTRPIQAESFWASLLWLASLIGYPIHYAATFGSLNVLSPLSPQLEQLDIVFLGIGLLYTFWLQWRGKLDLFAAALITLLLIIVTGKVFSPQYLIWITPLIAYRQPAGTASPHNVNGSNTPGFWLRRAAVNAFNWKWLLSWGCAGLLTTLIYPGLYLSVPKTEDVPLLPEFGPLVLARNVLIVGITLALLYQATRRPSTKPFSASATIEDDGKQENPTSPIPVLVRR